MHWVTLAPLRARAFSGHKLETRLLYAQCHALKLQPQARMPRPAVLRQVMTQNTPPSTPPSFLSRIAIAIGSFFAILGNGRLAADVSRVRAGEAFAADVPPKEVRVEVTVEKIVITHGLVGKGQNVVLQPCGADRRDGFNIQRL